MSGDAAAPGKPADRLVRGVPRPDPSDRPAPDVLLPPAYVRARAGRGQVTVRWTWSRAPAGYLVSRADRDGELSRSTTAAATSSPSPTGRTSTRSATPSRPALRGRQPFHDRCAVGEALAAVAPVRDCRGRAGRAIGVNAATTWPARPPVAAHASARSTSQLLLDGPGADDYPVGDDLAEAFRSSAELGARDGPRPRHPPRPAGRLPRGGASKPVHDFSRVDVPVTGCSRPGFVPIVELSFMPADLSDLRRTVFDYRGSSRRRATSTDGATLMRRSSATSSTATAGTRSPVAVRGLERAELAGLLNRHRGRLLRPVRRDGAGVRIRRSAARSRWSVHRRGRLGRRPARSRPAGRRPDRLRVDPHLRGAATDLRPIARARARPADLVDRGA